MARAPRIDISGYCYHVLNRANGRARMYESDQHYRAFEELLAEAVETFGINILAYTIMPNHWHLVIQTTHDGQMGESMKWITQTHTQQHHIEKKTVGTGHLYQGRYKSFPIETDSYLVQVIRYVERNPVRAKLVPRAEDWRWGSLWRRTNGSPRQQELLAPLPTELPYNYLGWVNESEDEETIGHIRTSLERSKPLGSEEWNELLDRGYARRRKE